MSCDCSGVLKKCFDTDHGIRCVYTVTLESNEMRSYPDFLLLNSYPHLVSSIILDFHALTGCDTMLPLSGRGIDDASHSIL